MKRRCYHKHRKTYKNYGGRGISVCDEWKNSFKSFIEWALKNGYKNGLTIERINNKEEKKILSEWCIILGLPYERTRQRIKDFGWSPEEAFDNRKFGGGKYGRHIIK